MTILNLTFLQDAALAEAVADSLTAKAEEARLALDGKTPEEILDTITDTAVHFGLKLLAAFAIFIIGAWIIKRVRKVVHKRMMKRKHPDRTVLTFTESLVAIILWAILIVICIGALGINTTSIAALLAAGGMAIGMSLSGTVQNFAGGIILLVFKPFKSGDFIEAQGTTGIVTSMNIITTTILTRDNKTVIIPNGALSNGNITNFSAQTHRRVEWTVNVPYGSDVAKVKDELMKLMKADDRILPADVAGVEAPFAGLSAMKDSSIELIARAWVATDNYWPVFFDINEKIYTELPARGIAFPFPQMDVHIKQ
ncbi:MAG: mechanosensitive ion channel [Bacteroidales bacterium]|nr:mechanosensitive ion channel [Bacteroidales bacterium]